MGFGRGLTRASYGGREGAGTGEVSLVAIRARGCRWLELVMGDNPLSLREAPQTILLTLTQYYYKGWLYLLMFVS